MRKMKKLLTIAIFAIFIGSTFTSTASWSAINSECKKPPTLTQEAIANSTGQIFTSSIAKGKIIDDFAYRLFNKDTPFNYKESRNDDAFTSVYRNPNPSTHHERSSPKYYNYPLNKSFSQSPAMLDVHQKTQKAAFTDIYSDYGIDTNSNGLYEYLTIEVGVNVNTPGEYKIFGSLYDSGGGWMMSPGASNTTYLNIGNQIVKLDFDGWKIYKLGANGSYKLSNLYLYDEQYTSLDYKSNPYNTTTYNYTEFEKPPAQFYPPHSDYGLDVDGNGYYDYLVIEVGVNVYSPGEYHISGQLISGYYGYVAQESNSTYLDIGVNTVQLKLNGQVINYKEKDGPYKVRLSLDIVKSSETQQESNIWESTGWVPSAGYCLWVSSMAAACPYWGELDSVEYTTSSYTYDQFQQPPLGKVRGYVLDTAGNPLSMMKISVENYGNWGFSKSVSTDSLGYYEISVREGKNIIMIEIYMSGVDSFDLYKNYVTVGENEAIFLNITLCPLRQPSTIKGHVYDSATKAPISDVSLSLNLWADTSGYEYYAHGYTNFTGYYEINAIIGIFSLRVYKSGYMDNETYVYVLEGTNVTLDIYLTPEPEQKNSYVQGYVSDVGGNPVSNATVWLMGWTNRSGCEYWWFGGHGVTNETGYYKIPAYSGRKKICAIKPNYNSYWQEFTIAENETKTISFALQPIIQTSKIYGCVTDASTGEPVSAFIWVTDLNTGRFNFTLSDSNGSYSMNIYPGEFMILAGYGDKIFQTKIVVSSGEEKNISLSLTTSVLLNMTFTLDFYIWNCAIISVNYSAFTWYRSIWLGMYDVIFGDGDGYFNSTEAATLAKFSTFSPSWGILLPLPEILVFTVDNTSYYPIVGTWNFDLGNLIGPVVSEAALVSSFSCKYAPYTQISTTASHTVRILTSHENGDYSKVIVDCPPSFLVTNYSAEGDMTISGTSIVTIEPHKDKISYGYAILTATGSTSLLSVFVNANPTAISSNSQSTITVSVTDSTNPITGATIQFNSNNGGTFSSFTDNGDGTYTTIFTAPNVTSQTIIRITATATKLGYTDGTGYTDITVNPMGMPTLYVSLTANPVNIKSKENSTITITITDGTSPATGCIIQLSSDNGGSFSPISDQGDGTYITMFTAPTVYLQTICKITAQASKSGYNSGSGYRDITVGPAGVTPPQTVTLSSPSEIACNSLKLSWSKNTDANFANYTIYQSTSAGTIGTPIKVITDQTTTSYSVTGLQPNTTYYFTVRVYNTAGYYSDSNQMSATTPVAGEVVKPGLLETNLLWILIIVIIAIAVVAGIIVGRRKRKAVPQPQVPQPPFIPQPIQPAQPPIVPIPAVAKNICPACRNPIQEGWAKCPYCKTLLRVEKPIIEPEKLRSTELKNEISKLEKILEKLKERFASGEMTEVTYTELKREYEEKLSSFKKELKKVEIEEEKARVKAELEK